MIKRTEIIPAILGFALSAVISVVGFMWARAIPTQYYERTVSKTQITAGESVTITWREQRDDDCDAIINRRIIAADQKVTSFETLHKPVRPVGQPLYSEFTFVAPPGLANGKMIYRVSAEFRCNIVQRILGGQTLVLPDIVFNYSRGTSP